MVNVYLTILIGFLCLFLGIFIGRKLCGPSIGVLQIDTVGDRYIYRFVFDNDLENLPEKKRGVLRIDSEAELEYNDEEPLL